MIAVRLATIDDAGAIARQTADVQRLHQEAEPDIFKPPSAELFPARKLAGLIENPNAIVAVAEAGGKVVGHIYGAVVHRRENEFHQGGAHLYVHQIAVEEGARRQGGGTALLAFVEDQARALGLIAVQIDHWAFNTQAKVFFAACGFAPKRVSLRKRLDAGS
jgi:GNAT superfamily N-acetyltransferase